MVTNSNSRLGRADLHIHPLSDIAASYAPEPLVERLLASNLDVIAITEHDRVDLALDVAERLRQAGSRIEVITGAEVSTQQGHILGLFLEAGITPGLSAAQAIFNIHAQGGLAIIAHPLLPSASCLSARQIRYLMRHADSRYHPDAIETHNSIALAAPLQSRLARNLARQLSLAETGGSDAHSAPTVANGLTRFIGQTAAELRIAIETRRSSAEGQPSETIWQNIAAFPARWRSAHKTTR